jgi:hypothetical protein
MRAATSGVEAVNQATRACGGACPAKQSGVARVTTYFHDLAFSLEFPFSTRTHDSRLTTPAQEYDYRVHTRYTTTKTTTPKFHTPPP